MIKRIYNALLIIGVFSLVLFSCGQTPISTTTPAPIQNKQDHEASPYPAPANSSYPGPANSYPEPQSLEEQNSNMPPGWSGEGIFVGEMPTSTSGATVRGILLAGDPLRPLMMPLYLAEMLTTTDDVPSGLVSVDKASAPKAVFNQKGEFVFINVPNGEYSLILDTIASSILLKNSETGENILFEVSEGETIDLGELKYPDLDIPRP